MRDARGLVPVFMVLEVLKVRGISETFRDSNTPCHFSRKNLSFTVG